MIKILGKKFFKRPTLVVAKDLLGKYLVRRIGGKTMRFMITEVEAYDGFKDRASHASRGKTKRNASMFESGGIWYVYFTYGMHYMLNIVTGPKNYPAAILIRSVDGTNGPARTTKQLKIDKKFNNKIASQKTGLWLEDNPMLKIVRRKLRIQADPPKCHSGLLAEKLKIRRLPRIGVNYAGPIWSKKKWRFVLQQVV